MVIQEKLIWPIWAHLVARGHTQIPGVYYTNNYAQVVSVAMLFIVLIMWLINKWYSKFMVIDTDIFNVTL